MLRIESFARCGFAVCLTVSIGLAQAAVPRAYVSATGSDSNVSSNCSLAAPCRTFAAVVGVVVAGGEVVALNTAGYGPVTITQSLTITGPNGTYAGVTAPNTGNGITINAPGATVRLRGLSIESQEPSTSGTTTLNTGVGINILAAASVSVENCVIAGFPYVGIAALVSTSSTQTTPLQLNEIDSVFVQDGYFSALYIAPNNIAGGATVAANVRNVSFNGVGDYTANGGNQAILVGDGGSLTVDNSQIVGYMFGAILFPKSGQAYMVATNSVWNNGATDVSVQGSGGSGIVDLRGNVLTGTSTTNPLIIAAWSTLGFPGAQTSDAAVYVTATGTGTVASISMSGNTISGNSVGVNQATGGTVSSFGNNQFVSNGTDVTGTLTSVAAK